MVMSTLAKCSVEYGAVAAPTEAFVDIYPLNPITPAVSQLFTESLSAATVVCDLYQGIESVTPLVLSGTEAEIAAAVTWAQSKFTTYLNGTIAGCSTSTLSTDYFYPNSSSEGGPLNPPASVTKNVGNNVYNKIYFTAAPTKPACSHSYARKNVCRH